jgi:hypothetical protein
VILAAVLERFKGAKAGRIFGFVGGRKGPVLLVFLVSGLLWTQEKVGPNRGGRLDADWRI